MANLKKNDNAGNNFTQHDQTAAGNGGTENKPQRSSDDSKENPNPLTVSEMMRRMGVDDSPPWQVTLTPVQKLGAGFAFVLLLLIGVGTVLTAIQLYHDLIPLPNLSGSDAKAHLDNYVALRQMAVDNATKTYDLFTRPLWPLLTGIIGILIGNHHKPRV